MAAGRQQRQQRATTATASPDGGGGGHAMLRPPPEIIRAASDTDNGNAIQQQPQHHHPFQYYADYASNYRAPQQQQMQMHRASSFAAAATRAAAGGGGGAGGVSATPATTNSRLLPSSTGDLGGVAATTKTQHSRASPPSSGASPTIGGGGGRATASATPFLTVALHKLHEILPDFCRSTLSEPFQAAKATAILDSSIATASFGYHYDQHHGQQHQRGPQHGQPRQRQSPLAERVGILSSPTRARPILDWLKNANNSINSTRSEAITSLLRRKRSSSLGGSGGGGAGGTPQSNRSGGSSPASQASPGGGGGSSILPSNSALVLEGEWDTYVAPFFLLAAAEVLYADMSHCRRRDDTKSSPAAQTPQQAQDDYSDTDDSEEQERCLLELLYDRIVTDIELLREVLCDPFLAMIPPDVDVQNAQPQSPPSSPAGEVAKKTLSLTVTAASSLAYLLDGLVHFCSCRAQLVNMQTRLFSTEAPTAAEMAEGVVLLDVLIQVHQELCQQWQHRDLSATSKLHFEEGSKKKQEPSSRSYEASASSNLPLLLRMLLQDLQTWKFCLQACSALDQCQ